MFTCVGQSRCVNLCVNLCTDSSPDTDWQVDVDDRLDADGDSPPLTRFTSAEADGKVARAEAIRRQTEEQFLKDE